jgi:hypothetical protein
MSLLAVGLLGIGFVVVGAEAGSASAPHTRVFLHAMHGPQVERRCLKTLFDEFRVDVGKAKGLESAASRAKADVVAEVEECVVTDSPRRGGVVEVGHAGHDAGTTDTVGLSMQSGTGGAVGRVTLTAEIDGVKKTFASGSDGRPIADAAHAATKPLLEWVAGRPHAETP